MSKMQRLVTWYNFNFINSSHLRVHTVQAMILQLITLRWRRIYQFSVAYFHNPAALLSIVTSLVADTKSSISVPYLSFILRQYLNLSWGIRKRDCMAWDLSWTPTRDSCKQLHFSYLPQVPKSIFPQITLASNMIIQLFLHSDCFWLC